MKIDLIDDVHLEFGDWNPVNPENSDVLVMAGDIILIKDYAKHKLFFEQVSKLYKNVIYVCGNHSHYHNNILTSLSDLRNHLKYLPNIHILEKQSIEIEDIVFIGGTLWTDANKEDPITMMTLMGAMNDYRVIINGIDEFHSPYSNEKKIFQPQDSVKDHKECLAYFRKELGKHKDEKCIVVSHHAPSFSCVNEIYRSDYHMNGGYASGLDQFILNRSQIKVWVHGHVHTPVDFYRGTTRILSNPRGYVGIERGSNDQDPYLPVTFEI
jgi:predicted phosphodiesterase